MKPQLFSAFALTIASPLLAGPVFQEKNGVLVMEAESTTSSLGVWKKKTDVPEYGGDCHLEFTGNTPESGPPKSPLKYSFRINKSGTYDLAIRCHKRLETKRSDISNDCYVSLKGDFDSGGDVPLKILKDDTKLFGGDATKWGWSSQLDVNHKKYNPRYQLKAGETYELTVSGRSKNFNIDRILFVHEDEGISSVKKNNPAESKTDADGGGSPPSGNKLMTYPARMLRDKSGRVIEARLVSKDGDTLTIIKDGRRFEIAISSLSEDDQKFLKDGLPE
jgi:hypothetical protein